MIVNGYSLLGVEPLKPMLDSKQRLHGVSHGLSEAGYDIRIAQDVWLHPLRRFALASSFEYFDMPDTMLGIVHDKSTNIRRGLMVGNSVAEPGWRGFLTLELFYFGLKPIKIKSGTGIAQIIFHELCERANYGSGKYQDQPNMPVAAKFL